MERNQGRRMSAEEKLRVVEEGRQSGATVSEICGAIRLAMPSFIAGRDLPDKGLWRHCVMELEGPRMVSVRNGLYLRSIACAP